MIGTTARRVWGLVGVGAVALALALAVAACGGSSKSASSGGAGSAPAATGSTTSAATGSSSSAATAPTPQGGSTATQVKSLLTAATRPTVWRGPTSSPKPVTGKKIFILSVTQAGTDAKLWAESTAAAAKALGWSSTVYDGEGEASRYASGMQQAIAQKYSAIVLLAIDPTLISTQVAAARQAGIPVVTIGTLPPPTSGTPAAPSATGVNANFGYRPEQEGQIVAADVAQASGGHANIALVVDNEFPDMQQRNASFTQNLKRFCPGCKIDTDITMTASEIGTPALVSKDQSVLQANPNINWVVAPFDDAATPVVQAIQQSGDVGKVKVVSYEGEPQDLSYVRQGIIQADLAPAAAWMGWETVDGLNRIFAGAKSLPLSVTNGEPARLITKANLPAAGQWWNGGFGYAGKYKTLWGIG